MRCELIRNEDPDWDWWTIERKEHDGMTWLEAIPGGAALRCSSRPSDACIEGPAEEMLAIAKAITAGKSVSFKRCAARRVGDTYELMSPRNSQVPAVLTLLEAYDLSSDIRLKLDFKAEEPKQLRLLERMLLRSAGSVGCPSWDTERQTQLARDGLMEPPHNGDEIRMLVCLWKDTLDRFEKIRNALEKVSGRKQTDHEVVAYALRVCEIDLDSGGFEDAG